MYKNKIINFLQVPNTTEEIASISDNGYVSDMQAMGGNGEVR